MKSRTAKKISRYFFNRKVKAKKRMVKRKIFVSSIKGKDFVYIDSLYKKDENVILFEYFKSKGYEIKYNLGSVYIGW